ncbi:hypothetical protein LSM04_007810 [Trypanosoma melophagium]|uniref:uncharacterized protein n=1 Tax=Trypanosoma melophagium TaxID=715481 RepID=UPI00351A3624|nr:hypothetical protein LSM04_007810 [Trypanosoma melophagium]
MGRAVFKAGGCFVDGGAGRARNPGRAPTRTSPILLRHALAVIPCVFSLAVLLSCLGYAFPSLYGASFHEEFHGRRGAGAAD